MNQLENPGRHAGQGSRDRGRERQARARADGAPTDSEIADALGVTGDDFHECLLKISNSSVVALDELWAVSDATGDQVSLLDTMQDPKRGRPRSGAGRHRAEGPPGGRDRTPAGAREARRRPLLLREPDPAGDRRGARGDRIARVTASHEGRPTSESTPSERPTARPSRPRR